MRKILSGTSDIEFRVVTGQGHSDRYTLPGYRAASRWDPVTGLGVPNVANLTRVLLEYPELASSKAKPKAKAKRKPKPTAKAKPKAKAKANPRVAAARRRKATKKPSK